MSSSKIFKQLGKVPEEIVPAGFLPLSEEVSWSQPVSAEGFVPLVIESDAAFVPAGERRSNGGNQEGHETIEHGRVHFDMSEEELAARLQSAFAEGLEQGRQEARDMLASSCRCLDDARAAILSLRGRVLRESEEDLLKLAIMLAKKIIQQEISLDRKILANIIKAAVDSAADREELVIRLNPVDYRLLTEEQQLFPNSENKRMTFKADDTVPCCGCMVDTAMGSIDARIEAQLDEIYRRLMEERVVLCGLDHITDDGANCHGAQED